MKKTTMDEAILNMSTTSAGKYRLEDVTTTENLEMKAMHDNGTVLVYGDFAIYVGYFYSPDKMSYYAAIYGFTGESRSCEAKVTLLGISDETFTDNGHAVAWALAHIS